MKIEVGKFVDGRSLKVVVRFEKASNFWVENLTWCPRIDEIELLRDVLWAINDSNEIKKSIGKDSYGSRIK